MPGSGFPVNSPASSIAATAGLDNAGIVAGLTNSNNFDRLTRVESLLWNLLTDAPAGWNFMGVPGAAVTNTIRPIKQVTAIADAVATGVLTITVPNAANAASVRVTLVGALGAGGAIGAGEANGTVSYDIQIVRTAGVNAVATISTAYGSGMGNVAGAATITVTAAMSAVSGAVGASNSFTVNVTITKGSGASANHTCMVYAQVLNANASGITVA